MATLNQQLVDELRRLAQQEQSVGAMIRAATDWIASTGVEPHPVDIIRHFRGAFGLTLAHFKPIADRFAYGETVVSDDELQNAIWPYIQASIQT